MGVATGRWSRSTAACPSASRLASRRLRDHRRARCGRPSRRGPRRSSSTRRTIRPGRVLDADEVAAMAAVASDADLYVISDEIYEHLVFDGRRESLSDGRSALAGSGAAGQWVLEGLRDDRLAVGLAVAPDAVARLALRLQSQAMTSAVVRRDGRGRRGARRAAGLRGRHGRGVRRPARVVVPRLNAAGLACQSPEGAFYVFRGARRRRRGVRAGAARRPKAVAVVPGSAFGEAGRGHVRHDARGLAGEPRKGLDGIERFMAARQAHPEPDLPDRVPARSIQTMPGSSGGSVPFTSASTQRARDPRNAAAKIADNG